MTQRIIGVYPGHNCNASLIDTDGSILFAMEEARLSRVKDQPGIPHRVLDKIRSTHGQDMLRVTIREPRYKRLFRDLHLTVRGLSTGKATPNWQYLWQGYWKALSHGRIVEQESREKAPWFLTAPGPLVNVGHHTAHASSAYYCSGFPSGPVMTLDGQGDDRFSCTFFWGNGKKLEPLNRIFYNEAPMGYNFQLVTAMLGFHGGRHPGKLTGLASHEEKNDLCRELLENFLDTNWKKKSGKDSLNYPSYLLFTPAGKAELKNVRETTFKEFTMFEMAHSIQAITEDRTLDLIRKNLGPPPYPSLALAGGVFGNVKLNQRIKQLGADKIFIQPAMGDEGLSLGASLYTAAQAGYDVQKRLNNAFLGSEYSLSDMEQALVKAGISAEKPDDIETRVAELLARGHVVARYDGRIEFGPRALGNRSILFHTQDVTVNEWLNKRLNRTEFMPFAPVTLAEDAPSCYIDLEGAEHAAKFMTITFQCSEAMKRNSPAVVHVDGTARPQILSKTDNPGYYRILEQYKKLTGIPSLINTSFNLHEEPIVCSPEDAIRAFSIGNLDYLAMGPFLLKHK